LNDKKWSDFHGVKYQLMFKNRLQTHEYFQEWVKELDIESALEIGGGVCEHKDLFKNYLCIDVNKNLKSNYVINADFLEYESKHKFDLVFSHAVIDHSEKPNEFLLKSIKLAKKYVFHSVYRGLQRQSIRHLPPIIDKDNYVYNQLSEFEIKRVLKNYNYILRKLENGNVCIIVKI